MLGVEWGVSLRVPGAGVKGVVLLAWLATALGGCAAPAPPGVRIALAGAQMPVELVESWLHDSTSRGFAVTQVPPVYLSQHGFDNLAKGACDIACTDRLLTRRELAKFGDREVRGCRVAFYGYALYVNPQNPLDAIFAKHVRLVFQGKIKDWHELAGDQIPDWQGPIALYGPPKGTRAGSVLSPLAKIWFADATWTVVDSDAEIVAKVAEDPYALGFASIGYDHDVRYLGLRMERTGAPAFPALEAIESEQYGLAKVIYVYFLAPPSPAVQAVVDYLQSDAGRAAIESTDMWAVPAERAAVPPPQ